MSLDINTYLDHQLISEDGELTGVKLRDLYANLDETPTRGKRAPRLRRFVLLNPDVFASIPLTGMQMRVLMVILGRIESGAGNVSIAPTSVIAHELGAASPNVSRAVAALMSMHFLTRIGRGHYRVNPWVGFNGEMREWKAELAVWAKPGAESKES